MAIFGNKNIILLLLGPHINIVSSYTYIHMYNTTKSNECSEFFQKATWGNADDIYET